MAKNVTEETFKARMAPAYRRALARQRRQSSWLAPGLSRIAEDQSGQGTFARSPFQREVCRAIVRYQQQVVIIKLFRP